MIKNNKLTLIITSFITLLPIFIGLLIWNVLPEEVPIHFDANGNVNGYSSKAVAIFVLPLFLFVAHWFVVLMSYIDPKSANIKGKSITFMFWVIPMVSILASIFVYTTALGIKLNVLFIITAFTGILFIFIGNYLPKIKPNYTVGIKVSWAINDEDNWVHTHRFGGYVMVIGGAVILATSFISTIWIFIAILPIITIAPCVYSYVYYKNKLKKQKQTEITTENDESNDKNPTNN